ncbi:MAG: hypothetical protein P1U42_03370 [Phycisphaerales bacterium]|nr:hypothetical protein [Phycisphaerales bacterium]
MSDQSTKNDAYSQGSHDLPRVRQPKVLLSDLTSDLLWIRVLRAPALALAPSRLISGAICAFLLSLILQITVLLTASDTESLNGASSEIQSVGDRFGYSSMRLYESFRAFDPLGVVYSVGNSAYAIRDTVIESPLISLLLGIPLIAVLASCGCAISRSAAIEFAQGRYASRDDTIGYSLQRIRQLVGAVIGPVIFCVCILLLIGLGGLLLSVPVLDVVGSILYAFGLALGILATIVLMLHVFALPLIVPALAVEGTDGFDAIQRSYAYVIGKPLRYLLYSSLFVLLGVVSIAVFTMLAQGSIEMTDWASSLFTNDAATRVLTGGGELGATKGTAHSIISIWRAVVELAIAGYVISFYFTSSTLLYLVIRRICDGQDMNEVWDGVGE